MTDDDIQKPSDPSGMDKLIQDAFPEAEMDEMIEEQRKAEVKSKALDKIKLEKELKEEMEKQREQIENEASELDDVDGFHLFKEQMDLPYKEYHPDHRVDIGEKVEPEPKQEEGEEDLSEIYDKDSLLHEPTEAEEEIVIDDELLEDIVEQCEVLGDGYVYCKGEDELVELEDTLEIDDEEEELDEEDIAKLEKEQMKIWTIVYSKKPELIIDKDEYDRILVDLLQSYADFKQTTIKMDKLQKIEQKEIADNQENRRATRRNPTGIRSFFGKVFDNYIDPSVKINDVKFKFTQFREYVRVVSNYEIELIDNGDPSAMKKELKAIWKTLAEEHKKTEVSEDLTI